MDKPLTDLVSHITKRLNLTGLPDGTRVRARVELEGMDDGCGLELYPAVPDAFCPIYVGFFVNALEELELVIWENLGATMPAGTFHVNILNMPEYLFPGTISGILYSYLKISGGLIPCRPPLA